MLFEKETRNIWRAYSHRYYDILKPQLFKREKTDTSAFIIFKIP